MKKPTEQQLNQPNLDIMSKEEVVAFLLNQQEKALMVVEDENSSLKLRIAILEEYIKKLNNQKFGRKSETKSTLMEQLSLGFDEVEATATEEIEEEVEETVPVKKPGRKKPSEANPNLEVEEIYHDNVQLITEGYTLIGEKVQERLTHRPAKLWIERHHYPVFRKTLENGSDDIRCECQSNEFLPHSAVGGELVATIMNQKYAMALPLYRIALGFNDLGAKISRQTMSNWLISASSTYLEPLYNQMKAKLLSYDILHADETTVQVLNHQDGSDNYKSYMWLYRSGITFPNLMVYEYQPGRGRQYPKEFLKEFKGYLHTDGYAVYNKLDNVIQVGCLAHGQRKFVDALKVMKGENTESYQIGANLLKHIKHIFTVENKFKSDDFDQVQQYRLAEVAPLFEKFKKLLIEASDKILPKSVLGLAISYNLNQLESFKRVLLDPRLELTNNYAERGIKPFVIGRKNWLFFNTSKGAEQSSIMYSVIQSAKENKLRVEPYLAYVFKQMSQRANWDSEFIDSLLPISKTLPHELYTFKY